MNRYSVMRIEVAKQQALKGQHWQRPEPRKSQAMDWTGDDERQLISLFKSLDIPNKGTPTHAALNKLIDNVQFSHGRHSDNSGHKDIQQIELKDGSIRIIQHIRQDW